MASAPASDGGRPRTLRRVVRRLIGRLLTDRPGRSGRSPEASVGAGVVDAMRVRAPWSLMGWWRARRAAAAAMSSTASGRTSAGADPAGGKSVTSATAAGTTAAIGKLGRPAVAGPRPGVIARRALPRSTATSLVSRRVGAGGPAPLIDRRPAGPDVRPGHNLIMRKPGITVGEALAARPPEGPSVSNPDPVAYQRVLGSAALLPGNVPDPAGAVRSTPAVAPERVRPGTPRERWAAAVAVRPLETPRALPGTLHAMASAISGRARPPLFTTGPNTRHALTAAGALGATTGSVIHLPSAPSGPEVSAVLAHELTHTRSPVARPRFFLGAGLGGLLDDDERSALSAGRNAVSGVLAQGRNAFSQGRSAAESYAGQGRSALDSAVGGGRAAAAGLLGQGRSAAEGFLGQGRSAAEGLIGPGRSTMDGLLGQGRGMADGLVGQGRGMADGLIGQGRQALAGAGETAAGIVDQLPVGGLGGIGDMAKTAARAAVMQAAAGPMGAASGFLDSAQNAAGGAVDSATGALDSAQSMASGAVGQAAGMASGAVDQASGMASGALDQAAGTASGAVEQVSGAVSGAVSKAAQVLDPDKVVEIVEQRLLREIERRGGRWAGIF